MMIFCDLFRMISLVLLSTSFWPTIILKFSSPVKNPSHMKPIKRVVGWEGAVMKSFVSVRCRSEKIHSLKKEREQEED
jgi:hypothetical protein